MNVRTLCLAILNFGDATGYEIKKTASESHFSYFIDASYGSIYPALNRLEQDGCVTAREERKPGKPVRKIYQITETGRAELCDWLSSPPEPDIFKSEFLLIAKCAEMLDRETLKRAIDTRVEQMEAMRESIPEPETCDDHPGAAWIAAFGRACANFNLNYLREHRDALEALGRDASANGTGSAEAAE